MLADAPCKTLRAVCGIQHFLLFSLRMFSPHGDPVCSMEYMKRTVCVVSLVDRPSLSWGLPGLSCQHEAFWTDRRCLGWLHPSVLDVPFLLPSVMAVQLPQLPRTAVDHARKGASGLLRELGVAWLSSASLGQSLWLALLAGPDRLPGRAPG